MVNWNPFHGCTKISTGCKLCYVYAIDTMYGKDASIIYRNRDEEFHKPILKNKKGEYKWKPKESVFICSGSDFFHEEADEWRSLIWKYIKERKDIQFFTITKRIHRVTQSDILPIDWDEGYSNFKIISTCENQDRADFRIPYLLNLKCASRGLMLEPMLEYIELDDYLKTNLIQSVYIGGEAGINARPLHYNWVDRVRKVCLKYDIEFKFGGTGTYFIKDNKEYHIPKTKDQYSVAENMKFD